MSKSSRKYREFIGWAKREENLSYDQFIQKLKSEALDIREDKESSKIKKKKHLSNLLIPMKDV